MSFPAKNFFRVTFRSRGQLQSYSFQASDSFNKQQWLNCIRQAKEAVAASCGASYPGNPLSEQAASRLEHMDRSDSDVSDCSMDTSEASAECLHMEHSDLAGRPLEV